MKFLANENIPGESIYLLREMGYDVASISEENPGARDIDVLRRSVKEKCIILTFDRDYGELIFKHPRLIPIGVVYFRFSPDTPEHPVSILTRIINQKNISLIGHFTIIEADRIRQRILR